MKQKGQKNQKKNLKVDKPLLSGGLSASDLTLLAGPGFLAGMRIGIGEVAEMTGVSRRKIRYWEERGLVHSVPGLPGTARRYDFLNVRRVFGLHDLLSDGFTLEAAAQKLEEFMAPLSKLYARYTEGAGGVPATSRDRENGEAHPENAVPQEEQPMSRLAPDPDGP